MVEFLFRQIYKNKQIIKYIIAGGLAASVDLALLYILTGILGVWYLYSSGLAFVVAFFVSFYLQKFWTFRDSCRKKIYRQMTLYFVVTGVNLAINIGGMYVLVDKLNIMYILAQILMGGFIAIGSFLM